MTLRMRLSLAGFGACLMVVTAVALATRFTPTHAEAQAAAPKIIGKVTSTIIKSFDAAGLPGLVSIQYRRVTASPGTRIENLTFADHAELCIPEKGRAVITLPDGSKLTAKQGDVFTIPLGATFKLVEFDKNLGWIDLCWFLNVK